MFEDKIVLTGVKPTGHPHLANYLGAIKPAIAMGKEAKQHNMFIADYHAINAVKDPEILRQGIKEIACIYLACGLINFLPAVGYSGNSGNHHHFICLYPERPDEQVSCLQGRRRQKPRSRKTR